MCVFASKTDALFTKTTHWHPTTFAALLSQPCSASRTQLFGLIAFGEYCWWRGSKRDRLKLSHYHKMESSDAFVSGVLLTICVNRTTDSGFISLACSSSCAEYEIFDSFTYSIAVYNSRWAFLYLNLHDADPCWTAFRFSIFWDFAVHKHKCRIDWSTLM